MVWTSLGCGVMRLALESTFWSWDLRVWTDSSVNGYPGSTWWANRERPHAQSGDWLDSPDRGGLPDRHGRADAGRPPASGSRAGHADGRRATRGGSVVHPWRVPADGIHEPCLRAGPGVPWGVAGCQLRARRRARARGARRRPLHAARRGRLGHGYLRAENAGARAQATNDLVDLNGSDARL